MYTKLDEITPTVQKAFINKEDKWFYWHSINPVAVVRAFINNTIKHKEHLAHLTSQCKLQECLNQKNQLCSLN